MLTFNKVFKNCCCLPLSFCSLGFTVLSRLLTSWCLIVSKLRLTGQEDNSLLIVSNS